MQRRRVEIRRREQTRKARYSRDKCTDHPRSSIPEDCVETLGLELETHQPVVEPVSAVERERNFPTQRQARKNRLITYQTSTETRGSAKSRRSGAITAKTLTEVCALRLDGGRTRARTWDPMIKSHLLYQLSYAPGSRPRKAFARGRRLAKRPPNVQQARPGFPGHLHGI